MAVSTHISRCVRDNLPDFVRAVLAAAAALLATGSAHADRLVVPLEGTWSVEDSVGADETPAGFRHTVAVPGLTNQARPPFPDVDHYETHEFVWTMLHHKVMPTLEQAQGLGRTRQKRNFFWYARTFAAPARHEHATLVVNKAQFGTAVWLNGTKIGEHAGCFTAGRFDVTAAMNWSGDNRLVIRIGAHPGALPDWAFWGSDGEKGPWTPGIYDRVELRLADNPVIEDVQVAPRIASSEIVVQTRLKNYGAARTVELTQKVSQWKSQSPAGQPVRQKISLAAGEEKTIVQTMPVADAMLWSPENPFLYTLETSTGGDTCATRFGMREFRFDPATRLPMLNGKVCYLRGASITLHRFFGDPQCGGLPWNEAWVRKFLVDIPRRMNWNAFRICIGPAPQQWLDIADEAGLLLQYEFPIWSDREATPEKKLRHTLWREDDITEQVCEFVRDNWNHPSVAIWDASNETRWDFLRKLVPAVRGLDLSGRPWDNGYEQPDAAGDPYEIHPYRCGAYLSGKAPAFPLADLEDVARQQPPQDWRGRHAAIINEYDWLWLHRDGRPTGLTKKVYDTLLGPDATADQRRALYAYLLGGLTEFWRAQRQHAGVLYLAYLDGDLPHIFTCDNFRNVAALELEPHFESYMREAFKPVGVYLDFWQPTLPVGTKRAYRVTLVNDTHEPVHGQLTLAWLGEQGGLVGAKAGRAVEIAAAGRTTCEIELATPAGEGSYLLTAEASFDKQPWSPTLSRRKVTVKPALADPAPAAETAVPASKLERFITRQGDKLMDGDREFRFIGANMPGLSLPYDYTMKLPERMTLPTPWEQADGLKTLDQMNLRVVRIWNLPIREPTDKPADGRMTWHYVQGPGQFNEESFKVLDNLFALANRYGIRVVFSLSDCWRYLGGVETYAAHRNRQGKRAFFTDPQVKEDFQQTIRHVLTRRNTVSGVPYKDDKAILCWELGNELWDVPYEDFAPWQREMTAFIKSLDPHHLIMDARGNVIPGEPDPNVDIFNVHYYGNDFAASCRSHQSQSRGKRPLVIGEFGPYDGKGFTPENVVQKTRAFLSAVQESGTAGALLWSMYFHHRDGGYYWHQIFTYPSVWSYHWPGFPSAEAQREIGIMQVMREAAFQIQGLPVPPVPIPDAPELLPIGNVPLLSWRGSAGASGYDVERAPAAGGPWTCIAENVSDADVAYRPLFSDTTARAGDTCFYRVTARNVSGRSQPSHVVGPVKVERICLADELQDFSRVQAKSDGLTLTNDYNALYAEYLFRAKGTVGDWLSYEVPGPMQSVTIVAFCGKEIADLSLQVSADGRTFTAVQPQRSVRRLGSPMSGPAAGQSRTQVEYESSVPSGNRFLRLLWTGPAELDRVEIYYK